MNLPLVLGPRVCAHSCPILCNPTDCRPPGSSLSVGFPTEEYWSGLPFPTIGDLPDPKIEPESLTPPALAGGFFTTVHLWCRRPAVEHCSPGGGCSLSRLDGSVLCEIWVRLTLHGPFVEVFLRPWGRISGCSS